MTRKSEAKEEEAVAGVILVVILSAILAAGLYNKLGIPIWLTYLLLLPLFVAALAAYFARQRLKLRAIQIANIDSMTGIEFERYLQKLLAAKGYHVTMTQARGDFGVDLVASRKGTKIAIQVKRHRTPISRRAISDAVAGTLHYRCNEAMVITNSYFTPGAITLGRSTGCMLVDRDTLVKWIVEFQKASKNAD